MEKWQKNLPDAGNKKADRGSADMYEKLYMEKIHCNQSYICFIISGTDRKMSP